MVRYVLLIAILIAWLPEKVAASGPALASAQAVAAQNIYVVVYRRGPNFDPAKGAGNAGIREHIRHFEALGERLIAAGTVQQNGDDLLGYVIMHASDQAAADTWLSQDPAVLAGTMSAQLRRWGVTEIRGWNKPSSGGESR